MSASGPGGFFLMDYESDCPPSPPPPPSVSRSPAPPLSHGRAHAHTHSPYTPHTHSEFEAELLNYSENVENEEYLPAEVLQVRDDANTGRQIHTHTITDKIHTRHTASVFT